MGRTQLVKRTQKENKNEKLSLITLVQKKQTSAGTFEYGTTHGPARGPDRQVHGTARINGGPARIDTRPGCGPSSEKLMGRAGPRPIL